MKIAKTYHFAVHSPHFAYPVAIKAEVDAAEPWSKVLDTIAKEATTEWVRDFPEYFDNLTAPEFYKSLSIIVSEE